MHQRSLFSFLIGGLGLLGAPNALEVEVTLDPVQPWARVKVLYDRGQEPLGAFRLQLHCKPGSLGDQIDISKPESGPWSQYFPAIKHQGTRLTVVGMAPTAGLRQGAGNAVAAQFELGLAGNVPLQGIGDFLDSVSLVEAFAPNGSPMALKVRMTTGVATRRQLAERPQLRMYGRKRTLVFSLGRAQNVKAWISDFRGRKVIGLLDRKMQAGVQEISWDGMAPGGKPLPAGAYLFHIEAGLTRYDSKVEVGP